MREALYDRAIFDAGDPSWFAWNTLSIAGMGEELTDEERQVFTQLTALDREPLQRVEELIAIKGRRAGGTTFMARILVYLCCLCTYDDVLAAGERGIGLFLASTTEQAAVAFARAVGIIDASPILKSMVVKPPTQDTVTLSNRTDLVILPASARSLRGITCVGICADETGWWQVDGNNSDSEILNAGRPALATTNGMLVIGSSPYRPEGELFKLFDQFYGKSDDKKILVSRATSRETNPTLPQSVIDRAMARDPLKARSEYLCEFRTDISDYVPRELVLAAVDRGVLSRLPNPAHRYVCFADASSGLSHATGGGKSSKGGDAFAAAIGHKEGETIVIDLVFERKPPFNASTVVAEISSVAAGYGIREIVSDRFSSGFMASELQRSNMVWKASSHDKSALYSITLPVLTSGSIRLPDVSSVVDQFCLLERKPGANGRDRIDARGGRSEDAANSVAGVVALLAAPLSGAESWLEFYRRQVEEPGRHNTDVDDISVSAPEFGFQFSTASLVAVTLPEPIASTGTCVGPRTGVQYYARHIGAAVVVQMRRDDAAGLLKNPTWRSLHADVAREILGETST
jgi:hypothetical protein